MEKTRLALWRFRLCMLTARTAARFMAKWMDSSRMRHAQVVIGEDTYEITTLPAYNRFGKAHFNHQPMFTYQHPQQGNYCFLTRILLPSNQRSCRVTARSLTAFSSPRLPHFAKCALKLALDDPAATPHKALSTLELLNSRTLGPWGKAGERQSKSIAASLKTSAAKRYILHSGSRAVPSRSAKRMVAIRPVDSWRMERRSAVVGLAEASPTPKPISCVSDYRRTNPFDS